MAWFNFLKQGGYFDPNNNPEPVKVMEGYNIPYWEILAYLEKLSIQIAQGVEIELTNELLEIIKNVSEHPKDNNRTWYMFIKILSNLPNDKIPLEIFNYLPIWFSGKFDTMLQTSELCDKLIPKFLLDNSSQTDIDKIQKILQFVFSVEKKEVENIWNNKGALYHSRMYLHFITDLFAKNDYIHKIVQYCPNSIILNLGRTLKFVLLDYPEGINSEIKTENDLYEVKITVEKENLFVFTKIKNDEKVNPSFLIKEWEDKSESVLKHELITGLAKYGMVYVPSDESEDIFKRLYFSVSNDLLSVFNSSSIRKLNDRYSTNEKVINVFALIFRDLLNEKTKQNPNEAIILLKTFWFDNKYSLPFFKRIVLYVISENWESAKTFFWDLVKENDEQNIFSTYKFYKELFELLILIQQKLSNDEIQTLKKIIENGNKEKDDDQGNSYWQLRWYSALNKMEPFKNNYLELSKQLNVEDGHFENQGEIRIRSGSISPLTVDELLNKSNLEIVAFINNFNTIDRWEEPNVSGLSDTLKLAVESQPEKFASEMELYYDVAYIYQYSMLNAFAEAWKKKQKFNWGNVLQFCLNSLNSENFYKGNLKLKGDSWNATEDWVVGAMANLLTDGLQHDENAFDVNLLPYAKSIVQILVSKLVRVDDFKVTNMDYPTYSFKSTEGKSLRALLDYSLRRARNIVDSPIGERWEPEIKTLFEGAMEKGIIDTYIMEGLYFEQFCYLDKEWILNQIKSHYVSKEREWLAFIGGFAFGNPPSTKELYLLFSPHYERIIGSKIKLKSHYSNGLARHLTAFYFWGYENLSSNKLLVEFLNNSIPDDVNDLIRFIWQQEQYQNSLSENEQINFQKLILDLWKYLSNKYEKSINEKELENLGLLTNWLVFAKCLNEDYTTLLIKSSKYVDINYSTHILIENLAKLKNKGKPINTAKCVGDILLSMNFKDYYAEYDKELLRELVLFLFDNQQKSTAEIICNRFASLHQLYFLKDIYDEKVGTK